MSSFVIPLLILVVLIIARVKKVNAYDAAVNGARDGLQTTFAVFPCLVAIYIMLEVMHATGITSAMTTLIQPLFNVLGIPDELTELIVLRPISGSGALAVVERIISTYGADSYLARCASVIMSSSETVLYVSAVYFSGSSVKKTGVAVPVSIICSYLAAILACAILRIM